MEIIIDTYRGPKSLYKRMSITKSKEFKEAIDLAMAGNEYKLRDIAKYVLYNYNLCMHIKEGSPDDLENEKIYTALEKEHPEIFAAIEDWVNYKNYRYEKIFYRLLITKVEY